jgi:hypothetical protein
MKSRRRIAFPKLGTSRIWLSTQAIKAGIGYQRYGVNGQFCAAENLSRACRLGGQKREVLFNNHTSAFTTSGHATALAQVRVVPIPVISRSLEHLVGEGKKRRRYREIDRLCRPEVDH